MTLALAGTASAIELTPDNWDTETVGKTVFVTFLAPWGGHCKRMKPDWDKVMKEVNGKGSTLVADVDCTAAGKPLCDSNGVQGFPTIKYGDPSALEDYQGGRDYDSLKKFADGLKPTCSPANIDLCDEEQTAEIKKLQDMSAADLDAAIEEKEAEIKAAEKTFEDELEKLQNKYKKISQEKDDAIKAVKDSGLGLMKAVKATAGKKEEL